MYTNHLEGISDRKISDDNTKNLLQLYLDLKNHYLEGKPYVAKLAVQSTLGLDLLYQDESLYEKLYIQFFLFYSLYCQNTNDVSSKKSLQTLLKNIRELNYNYEIDLYENHFYKHKKENLKTLKSLNQLLLRGQKETLYLCDFTSIPRVGYKTASLIYNQFLEPDTWPIVDVNVLKGYMDLCVLYDLPTIKNPDKLFFQMVNLNNFCDENFGFRLCRLLYTHRKNVKYSGLFKPCIINKECALCKHVLGLNHQKIVHKAKMAERPNASV